MQEGCSSAAPGGLTGQRRYVTVLFSDVSDSSRLAESLEAEEFSSLLEQFRHFARDIVPRHGGCIARLQGDGVLALFGHFEAREDDGRRAAEAALELHRAVAGLKVGPGPDAAALQLHSGIHGGLVLLIEGDIERGRYDVVGEVPNTAARLCSLAGSGEIMASAETLGPQAHFFEIDALRQLTIRGRSAALDVVRVQARSPLERRIDAAARRGVVPFSGRQQTLGTLTQAAQGALSGQSLTFLLVGEPGIGKTRLIDEFVHRLDLARFCVLRGYCEAYLGAAPLQPFMHWLREALGWRTDALPEANHRVVRTALAALSGERIDEFSNIADALVGTQDAAAPVLNATVRVSVLVDFLALLARQRALVLVLDDWQWADDASRHALESLRARDLPMLVVLASRPTSDDDHAVIGARVLPLQPLEQHDAEAAVAAWLPGADPFIVQEVLRQSGGSPLFIEELCHAAAAGSNITAAARTTGVAWISSLVASRLARLAPDQADVLRKASVVGNTLAVWLLERLSGVTASTGFFEALAEQDFLVSTGTAGMLRFKHGITRDAVYATVEPVQRRALHQQVAELLESSASVQDAFDRLEALSYHFDAAGQHRKSAHYAEAAGDKALGAMSLDRARAQYITTLRAMDAFAVLGREDKLRWCAVAQKLGQTCVFDPLDVAYSFVLFERAAQLARETGDLNTLARAEYWLGYVNYGKGRPKAAVTHAESALGFALQSDDQRLVAQVQATLAQALASAGRYGRALPLFVQAVNSKRQLSHPGSSTAIGSAYTLGRMAYTFGDLGRFEEARLHFDESLHLLGDKVHSVGASVRELMCAVYLWQGLWEQAREVGREGADMALRCRSRYLTMMGRALSACGEWAIKRDLATLHSLRESTYWIEDRGGAVSTSLNYGWLVEASVALNLHDEARRHAARLFLRARVHDRHGEAMGCRALARLAALQQRADLAERYLARAERAAEDRDSPRERSVNLLARAELASMLGRAAPARQAAGQALDAFEGMQMLWHAQQARELLLRN